MLTLSNSSDGLGLRSDVTFRMLLVVGVLAVILLQAWSFPRSIWEFDESLFVAAIRDYEPLRHHPPPPGYPVFIALAKGVHLLAGDPFRALVILSALGSVAGFVALTFAFGNMTRDRFAGLAGALMFYLSPAMIIHSTLPISDPPALALFAFSLLAATWLIEKRTRAGEVFFGIAAALTVGCRPQYSIVIVPLLLIVVWRVRSWRSRVTVLVTFTAVCLAWLIPLVIAAGGPERWLRWESDQASYFAAHDAELSRSGRGTAGIAIRFIAHAWGPKFLSVPVLIAAITGLVVAVRRKSISSLTLLVPSALFLGFCLAMMDPADGVRYALPWALATAFLAGLGLVSSARAVGAPWVAAIVVVMFGVGFAQYTRMMVDQRTRSLSPPVLAANFITQSASPDSVILYELPLWPHAKHLLRGFQTLPIDKGLAAYLDKPSVPLFIYADGGVEYRRGKVFEWEVSDAYGKLTRNHYRVVSVIPIPATQRYKPLSGVFPLERNVKGEEWRWLGPQAELLLPDVNAGHVAVRVAIPPSAPYRNATAIVQTNGGLRRQISLAQNIPVEVLLPLEDGETRLRITSASSFVPARQTESANRDRRQLSLQLLSIEQQFYVPRRGVFDVEHARGEEWRWLEKEAAIVMDDDAGKRVTLTFGLPAGYPHSSTSVEVSLNGARATSLRIQRGGRAAAEVMLPGDDTVVSLRSERTFVPARQRGGSRDSRELAVQLLDVQQAN